MITVRSTINIAGQTVPQIIPVVQGDTGRAIQFTITDFTIPTGSTARYYIQKPSGNAVYNNATIEDNNVVVNLTAQAIAETGDNYGQVRIENDGEIVTSFDFILLVKAFRGIGAVESKPEMNIFDQAVEQAEAEITEAKEEALAEIAETGSGNIAVPFDAADSYLAGEYVIYNAKFYKFTSAHTGPWTGSDAEELTVGDALTDLEDETNQLKEDLTDEITEIRIALANKKDADTKTVIGQDGIEIDSTISTYATSFVITLPYNSSGYTEITVLNAVDILQKDYALGGWEVTNQNILRRTLTNDIYRFNNPIDVNPGETLTLTKHLCIYANATNVSDRENITGNLTYIVPSGATQMGCRIFRGDFSTFDPNDYSIFRNNVITVDLTDIGATVYGGSVDIVSGTVVSTKNADGTDRTTPDVYDVEQHVINITEGVSVFNCTGFELSITYPTVSEEFKKPSNIYIVAPSDATEDDKSLADYICNGTNDELTIQQAVDRVGAQGTVVLLDGNYYIDSFISDNTSDACSTPSAIYVKKSKNVQSLTIMGLTEGGGEQAWTCGAILHVKSSATGNTQSSVFNVSSSYVNVDYFTVNFANFKILVDTVNYPVICINTEYIGASQIRNIRLKGGDMGTASTTVPVQGMIGIKGQTGWGAGTGQKWAQCGVYGFYEGFAVGGEHLTCENLLARYCVYGYTINNYNYNHGTMSHPLMMINCADELNCHLPLFNKNGKYNAQTSNARQPIYIIGFTIEWRPGQIPGKGTPEYAEEVTPGAFGGIIDYVLNTNESTNALDMPFWKSGSGIGFTTINRAHRRGGTSSERNAYAPTFMQTYYDTTLNKFLIYDGTAWKDANGTSV